MNGSNSRTGEVSPGMPGTHRRSEKLFDTAAIVCFFQSTFLVGAVHNYVVGTVQSGASRNTSIAYSGTSISFLECEDDYCNLSSAFKENRMVDSEIAEDEEWSVLEDKQSASFLKSEKYDLSVSEPCFGSEAGPPLAPLDWIL